MLGKLMNTYKDLIRIMGASVILLMGLHMVRLIRIPFLEYEKKLHVDRKPLHFFSVFIVGMAFGAGWSPCIGPLLGTVLILAGGQETVVSGMTLLGMYAVGLAFPFVILSCFSHFLVVFVKSAGKSVRYLHVSAGILLILIAGLLMANKLFL
ncbi:cytochrome c biogenesis protein CcdA [sediment metagenome]|uniref:Cytochrome c biogenesis protein CcdA n=1 Tax=sediment metagenome TaxID=749907 RepID=D9PHF8_9ZZZZ